MMGKTRIEWTQRTWSPVTGCTPISPGCAHCYAERMARRLAGRYGYPEAPGHFDVVLRSERLDEPLKWRKPTMCFVCSMGDLFHDAVPLSFLNDVFGVMVKYEQHTFQVLTKRPQRMKNYFDFWAKLTGVEKIELLPNVWLGVTAENQRWWELRRDAFFDTPATVHFVSYEPAIGELVFSDDDLRRLDWVIAGAETGPRKRPMQLDWARSLRDQCQSAGVPFFFKRDSNGNREFDGQLWEQYPGGFQNE